MKPDFMLFNPGNKLLLVAEVKATRNANEQWAAKLRRNLMAHGLVPESPYFLLVLPDHVYLWKNASPTQEVCPNFVSDTSRVLKPYLSRFGDDLSRLSESGLELAVKSWLNHIANPMRHGDMSGDEKKLLEESGLANQIREGAVLCGDPL